MEEHRVVPDVIDKVPLKRAEIVYPSGVMVNMGSVLTPTQVKDAPRVTFTPDDKDVLYAIIMTDPDADPSVAEVHHWMMINVRNGDSRTGQTHSEYIGSGPPEGTGLHRYCFLVYKQPPNYVPTDTYRGWNRHRRYNFSLRQFAKENNLGDPVAGNFYRAEYDDYVPIMKAAMTKATEENPE